MVPKKGLSVKLTDKYIANTPALAHLKDIKLTIMKIDLKGITANGTEYEVYYTDGSYIHQVIIDTNGQSNGCDVFESWVTKVPSVPNSFNFSEEFDKLKEELKEMEKNEPRNNDGRATCFWCSSPTRKAGGGQFDVCTSCGR